MSIGDQVFGFSPVPDEPVQVVESVKAKPVSSKEQLPPELQLSVPEDEEIFLDASGKPFQLAPSPPPPSPVAPAAVSSAKKEPESSAKTAFSLSTSSSTLLVFLRGWW